MTPSLENKLSVLKSQLISALLEALRKPTIRKSAVVMLVSLLIRLKAGSAARNTLLRTRSQVIKSHIRNIRFEGNIGAYVADLAIVCFTGIKHTADWFLASFKENDVASCKSNVGSGGQTLISSQLSSIGQRRRLRHSLRYSESKSSHQM